MQTVDKRVVIKKNRKAIIILRVEHATTGTGPYQHGWQFDSDRHYDENHPVPHRDRGIAEVLEKYLREWEMPSSIFCGFGSLSQLVSWFNTKEMTTLMLKGFVVKAYRSHHYVIGEKQVIFVKEEAEEVRAEDEIPWCDIDNVLKE